MFSIETIANIFKKEKLQNILYLSLRHKEFLRFLKIV